MKYYTPKIEEFRIGFECEVLIKDTWEKGVCKVVSNEMSEGCIEQLEVAYNWVREDGKVFEYSINPYEVDSRWIREFRVKYLDREDIESLGYEVMKGASMYYKFGKDKNFFEYDFTNHLLRVYTAGFGFIELEVKNKSELKKFLEMYKRWSA